MLMKKIAHLYHKIFGWLFMTCKEAVAEMNSRDHSHKHSTVRVRLWLHLLFCRMCTYYSRASRTMGQAIKDFISKSKDAIDIENLNHELVKKFISKNSEDRTDQ